MSGGQPVAGVKKRRLGPREGSRRKPDDLPLDAEPSQELAQSVGAKLSSAGSRMGGPSERFAPKEGAELRSASPRPGEPSKESIDLSDKEVKFDKKHEHHGAKSMLRPNRQSIRPKRRATRARD